MSENIQFRRAGGQNPLILVPVCVDAKGPYQFILDTGAYRALGGGWNLGRTVATSKSTP